MIVPEISQRNLSKKTVIIFDLDGTLTESKSKLEKDMAESLGRLLNKKRAAIIGGGSYAQFEKQFLAHFLYPAGLLKNLFLFPTSGARFYRYDDEWREIYSHILSQEEKENIFDAFEKAFRILSYEHTGESYGELFEDRGTQISFSPLGQCVVAVLGAERGVALKQKWNAEHDTTRKNLARVLQEMLPDFEVRVGGLTTIDVTKKGIDKGYGIRQIEKNLQVPKSEMLFVGDALYEGGNDHPVLKEGVETIAVSGPEDTKKIIKILLL